MTVRRPKRNTGDGVQLFNLMDMDSAAAILSESLAILKMIRPDMKTGTTSHMFACLIFLFLTNHMALAQDGWSKIDVSLKVPHPGYSVAIESVHAVANKTLVLAVIKSPDPTKRYPMVITTVSDNVKVPILADETEIFIIGKTWTWNNNEKLIFFKNREEFYQKIIAYSTLDMVRK